MKTNLVQELAKVKYVFFDVDGVLSSPKYDKSIIETISEKQPNWVTGFTDSDWLKFNVLSEHPYKDCDAPQFMKDFVNLLCSDSTKELFALTADNNSFALQSKVRFIKDNYVGFKESNIIMVSSTALKLDVIKYIAERDNKHLNQCLLIEDTYQTVIDAELAGILSMHVVSIPDLVAETK